MNMAALRLTPPAARTVIPRGLRNHLHWQAGHLVTVQASLLYLRSGLTPFLDETWFAAFAKGTAPAVGRRFQAIRLNTKESPATAIAM